MTIIFSVTHQKIIPHVINLGFSYAHRDSNFHLELS